MAIRFAFSALVVLAFAGPPTDAPAQPVPLPIADAPGSGPRPTGGFGKFRWGMSTEAAEEVEPALKPFEAAEPVAFEAEALETFTEAERRAAKAEGRKAFRAWKKRPRPAARITARRHWIDLQGLTGRLELRFVDDRLYEGIVRVLYRTKQKPAAARVLDTLVAKYGSPLDPPEGYAPPEERPRLDFAVPGGRLQVIRRRVTPRRKQGMLRLHYRADILAEGVDRYLQGLRGRLLALEPPPPEPDPAEAEKAPADPLMENL